eukprot:CAMPEP_0119359906 /NCGR_PEP_ID=MMETSP1334-20130426/7673_1 /TAXON_ID=127549 /ORGANISM="Calcidiscus leptoporus, Strain RCC1130" /LENGTH=193 /DNA_ID=CAMNT_0007374655 /DNA_START=119 /DNA_END=698 /DNA_ORIENTATION=+
MQTFQLAKADLGGGLLPALAFALHCSVRRSAESLTAMPAASASAESLAGASRTCVEYPGLGSAGPCGSARPAAGPLFGLAGESGEEGLCTCRLSSSRSRAPEDKCRTIGASGVGGSPPASGCVVALLLAWRACVGARLLDSLAAPLLRASLEKLQLRLAVYAGLAELRSRARAPRPSPAHGVTREGTLCMPAG